MKKMICLCLLMVSLISTVSFASDSLDANCLQLNDQCIYKALQNAMPLRLKSS